MLTKALTKPLPYFLARKKSITEPIIIPIKLRIKPNPFPKTKAPAGQVNAPGIIGITVWIICIRIKTQGAPFPRESKKLLAFPGL